MPTLGAAQPIWFLVLSLLGCGAAGLVLAEHHLARRERRRRRLAMVARATSVATGGASEQAALVILTALRKLLHNMALMLGGVHLVGAANREKVQALLVSAGFRRRDAISTYATVKTAAALAGLLAGIGISFGAGMGSGAPVLQVMGAVLAMILAGLVPELVVTRLAAARRLDIRTHLADAIDLMIISANAGQSLDVSLARVAEEIAPSSKALGDELQVTVSELRGFSDRRQPLENLARRTGLKEIRSVTATLIQTIRYGTPLAQSLKTLAREMREARLLAVEEQAARLPALLSLPLMFCIMPAVFIVTAGPSVLMLMEMLAR